MFLARSGSAWRLGQFRVPARATTGKISAFFPDNGWVAMELDRDEATSLTSPASEANLKDTRSYRRRADMAGGRGLWRIRTMNLVGRDRFGRWDTGPIDQIGHNLQNLLDRVLSSPACEYTDVRWFPIGLEFEIDPGEVLVYFVTRGTSIVRRHTAQPLGPGGSTFPARNGDMISEVYVDVSLASGDYLTLLANLVFHEAMHNKIDIFGPGQQTNIHDTDGTGLATGNRITGGTGLSATNITNMGRAMHRVVPQFLAPARQGMVLMNGMPTQIGGGSAPVP